MNPGAAGGWQRVLQARARFVFCVMALWGAAIAGRLVQLQVVDYGFYVERAEKQHERTIKTPARRGELRDRDGRVLAYDVAADTVIADPRDLEDPPGNGPAPLCGDGVHGGSARGVMESILARDSAYAYVERQTSPRVAERIRALGLDGIDLIKENRRYYPNGSLARTCWGTSASTTRG